MTILRYTQVFVPGGLPDVTYISRDNFKLEDRLRSATDNLCKLVVVTGQTKSGKTVLARKVYPKQNSVWINGGGVANEAEFWSIVGDELGICANTSTKQSEGQSSTLGTRGESGLDLLVLKGKGEVSAVKSENRSHETTETKVANTRITSLKKLAITKTPLIIDDFHYLPRELQGPIVRSLKPYIFDGLPVICIAIPHRRYDAIKVEREMTGRIEQINVPTWEERELNEIGRIGFDLLNILPDISSMNEMVKQALGSPHLMQEFCREICKIYNIETTVEQQKSVSFADQLDNTFQKVAENTGRSMFDKLARGPKSRTDRKMRKLKSGDNADIYRVVMYALASLKPGMVTIDYEALRAAIRESLLETPPQAHEVSRVLKHMATISSSDDASTPVVDYEENERMLHVLDPFFAYFLRWGQLVVKSSSPAHISQTHRT